MTERLVSSAVAGNESALVRARRIRLEAASKLLAGGIERVTAACCLTAASVHLTPWSAEARRALTAVASI